VVRDLSSGSSLATTTDTSVLATGSTFPIESSQSALRLAAMAPSICLTSRLPVSTVGGVDSLALMEFELQYPASSDYSSLKLDQILVSLTDTLGAPLDPAHLFDRLGYRDPTGVVSYQQFVLTESGAAKFLLGTEGLQMDPGDSISLTLIGDISIGSAIDHFILAIGSEAYIGFVDMTDTSSSPGIDIMLGCTAMLPFATDPMFVYQPAGKPHLLGEVAATRVTYRGEQDVTLFKAELEYDSPVSQGDLSLAGLHGQLWQRTTSGLFPIDDNSLFTSVTLFVGGTQVVTDSVGADEGLSLALNDTVIIQQGDRPEIVLKANIETTAAIGNYVVVFEDSTWLHLTDANLATVIYPNLTGATYPLLGTEISVVPTGLGQSFSNYPNPFNPDEGPTIITYVLSQDASINIDLFTITGELVKHIAVDAPRMAGSNQADTWFGRNGSGLQVMPGTYFCQITARYADGSTETFRRKVALIR